MRSAENIFENLYPACYRRTPTKSLHCVCGVGNLRILPKTDSSIFWNHELPSSSRLFTIYIDLRKMNKIQSFLKWPIHSVPRLSALFHRLFYFLCSKRIIIILYNDVIYDQVNVSNITLWVCVCVRVCIGVNYCIILHTGGKPIVKKRLTS